MTPQELVSLETLANAAYKADFGDERLSARFTTVLEAVGKAPGSSFPDAMTSAELEGFYRFINNSRVDFESATEPFFEMTSDRCGQAGNVLVAHDTTEFAFSGERAGLGRLRTSNRGFLSHIA